MLLQPHDPLLAWLREGHLGGISPGSFLKDVHQRWGEPYWSNDQSTLYYGFDRVRQHTYLVAQLEQGVVWSLQTLIYGNPAFYLPEPFPGPPYALGDWTSILWFLDLMSANRVEVQRFPFHRDGVLDYDTYETRSGVKVLFHQGRLYRIWQLNRLALWSGPPPG